MTTLPFISHIFIFFLHPHRCYCPYGTSQLSTCLLAASTTTWQCGEEQPAQTAHIREASGHGQHAKMIPERCAVRGKCPPAQTQRRPSWLNTPLLHKTPPLLKTPPACMHATTAVLLTTEESEAASILAHLHLRERAGLRTVSRKVLTRPQFSENPGTEDSTPATDPSSESPC